MERTKLTDEQVIARDIIVFGEAQDWTQSMGGVKHFKGLALDELEQLVKEGFADPEETQNDAPSVGEFLDFMREYDVALAHGYVVSNDREDVRVSIEGLEIDRQDVTYEIFRAFVRLCRFADEFDDDDDVGLYAWWD